MKSTVDGVFDGNNGTVMCYGQSGSGKSFQMWGPGYGLDLSPTSQDRGIVQRAVEELRRVRAEAEDA